MVVCAVIPATWEDVGRDHLRPAWVRKQDYFKKQKECVEGDDRNVRSVRVFFPCVRTLTQLK
jgi:hypothetical protein